MTNGDAPPGRSASANEVPTDPVTRLADAVSVASDFGAIFVLGTLVELLRRRRPAESLGRLAAAGFASLVVTRTLKHYFGVTRTVPSSPGLARTPSSPGFPSGHTLAAFTSALVLPRTRWGRAIGLCFAAAVAWARVRVGHHRVADVVAGAGAGVVAGSAVRVLASALAAGGR